MKRNEALSACLHVHEEKKIIAIPVFKTKLRAFKGTLFPNGHEFETIECKESTPSCINYRFSFFLVQVVAKMFDLCVAACVVTMQHPLC